MQVATAQTEPKNRESIPQDRIDSLRYIPHEYEVDEVAFRLKRQGYRGAICGPAGCGKTILLQALGDELMDHGLSPLTLRLEQDRQQAMPAAWRRTIRKARHTDALLLDDYDLLPWWARVWVWAASMRAGAVVVTAKRDMRFKTLARPTPTVALLKKLVEQLAPAKVSEIDYAALFGHCQGNMRIALQIVCLYSSTTPPTPDNSVQNHAS